MTAVPQLIVRNLEESVVKRLRQRAAELGVSVEEAHRRLLRELLKSPVEPPRSFKEHLLNIPIGGDDADFETRRSPNRSTPIF